MPLVLQAPLQYWYALAALIEALHIGAAVATNLHIQQTIATAAD